MLIPLRSLWEPVTPVVIIPPPVGGGGGGSVGGLPPWQPLIPPRVGVEITLTPARFKIRAGKLEASGGANVQLSPVVGKISVNILEATAGATVQIAQAMSKLRTGKLSATGVDNDPLIALSILDL